VYDTGAATVEFLELIFTLASSREMEIFEQVFVCVRVGSVGKGYGCPYSMVGSDP